MFLSDKCVILVVDDEETFRETTAALLLRDGYEAKGCASTAAALDAIRSGPPGLLICDINMPGNAELEFIREVHAASPGLPVILITGYPTVQTAASAVTLGVVAYLLKPVVPSELMKLVAHTVLQRQACLRVEQNLNRVEAWNRDLASVRLGLRPRPEDEFARTMATFVTLTLGNVMESLGDIRDVVQVLLRQEASPEIRESLSSARPLVLISAIQDAINAIEKTKGSFKSKELGELRLRLEAVLQDAS